MTEAEIRPPAILTEEEVHILTRAAQRGCPGKHAKELDPVVRTAIQWLARIRTGQHLYNFLRDGRVAITGLNQRGQLTFSVQREHQKDLLTLPRGRVKDD